MIFNGLVSGNGPGFGDCICAILHVCEFQFEREVKMRLDDLSHATI
jgi:hypothetical protein